VGYACKAFKKIGEPLCKGFKDLAVHDALSALLDKSLGQLKRRQSKSLINGSISYTLIISHPNFRNSIPNGRIHFCVPFLNITKSKTEQEFKRKSEIERGEPTSFLMYESNVIFEM
jgi:hypothetical protein